MSEQRVSIPILDMGCGGAGALLLERSLSRVAGVRWADVNPAREVAYIDFDPQAVTVEALISKIRLARFGTGSPELAQAEDGGSEADRTAHDGVSGAATR